MQREISQGMSDLCLTRNSISILLAISLMVVTGEFSSAQGDISGTYNGIEGHRASMTVSHLNGSIRLTFRGGSSTSSEVAAGDCEAVAEGDLIGNRIRAHLIPFEGELSSLTEREIGGIDSSVQVEFEKNVAVVSGTFAHCGLQNYLNGKYRRQ